MTTSKTVIQEIAHLLAAIENCEKATSADSSALGWLYRHRERLASICKEHLPSGSGIDSGTTLNRDKSTPERIVLDTAFHHMNEGGVYDGWTNHQVIVTPSFVHGMVLRITGKDRNMIKEYLHETFHQALGAIVKHPIEQEDSSEAIV